MMKNRIYWTYNQRHPRPSGRLSGMEILQRLYDRLEDGILAVAADREFRRIERRNGEEPGYRRFRFVLEFETYENVVFEQDQLVKRRNTA